MPPLVFLELGFAFQSAACCTNFFFGRAVELIQHILFSSVLFFCLHSCSGCFAIELANTQATKTERKQMRQRAIVQKLQKPLTGEWNWHTHLIIGHYSLQNIPESKRQTGTQCFFTETSDLGQCMFDERSCLGFVKALFCVELTCFPLIFCLSALFYVYNRPCLG